MIEHLVVSTVVLLLVMLAARVLPVTARTRHAMLLCALAKFAVPSSLFPMFGVQTINVLPMQLRVLDGTGEQVPAAQRVNWMLIVWAAMATLVFARWLLLRTRTVAAALRSPAPPSQRELDALAGARKALNVRTAVDLVRSPVCEAPAVLRVIRPVILLPARGCDDLDDDELRALLLHELAHVARRDNLVALFGALASSLLWFHPLVWIALHQLNAAREQACDERVAEVMEQTESYLEALMKVCRAVLAPRTAGASCMAGANVKERMEHLMHYETLRRKAWSHRGLVAASLVIALAATAFAVERRFVNQNLYSLRFIITPAEQTVLFDVNIVDNATGQTVAHAKTATRWGEWATVTDDDPGIELRMRMERNRPAELFLIVRRDGALVQRNLYTWEPTVTDPNSEFSGEPVSINLKDADIHDVLNTFAAITGLKIEVAPEVTGTVSLDVRDMPWDEALLKVVKQVGAKAVIDGKTIRITK